MSGRVVWEYACSVASRTSDGRVGGQDCIVFSRCVYGAFVSVNVLRTWARETGSSEVCVAAAALRKTSRDDWKNESKSQDEIYRVLKMLRIR
jgi:hypothetical protein